MDSSLATGANTSSKWMPCRYMWPFVTSQLLGDDHSCIFLRLQDPFESNWASVRSMSYNVLFASAAVISLSMAFRQHSCSYASAKVVGSALLAKRRCSSISRFANPGFAASPSKFRTCRTAVVHHHGRQPQRSHQMLVARQI